MKRAVIIGATSGIGREVAKQLLLQGWHLGIAGAPASVTRSFAEQRTGPRRSRCTGRYPTGCSSQIE